jgi:hypothetical protein
MSTSVLDTPYIGAELMTERDWELQWRLSKAALLSVPFGGEDTAGGYGTEGDIVYTTNDNVDLNALWDEAQQALAEWNKTRNRIVSLLTYQVLKEIEEVPQVGEASFEEASEFGEPEGERLKLGYFQLGFDFKDYDRATRFTWKALRDMDARQVRAVNNAMMQADERLMFRKVMEAVFDNRNRETDIRNNPYPVYPLYNADGTVPPPYQETTFDGTHNHYLVSNNAVIDSGDLEAAYEHIGEHGYSIENGTQIIHLMNRAQVKEVRKFRMGQVNNNGIEANYDFIPALANNPAQILDTPLGLLGSLPPNFWQGMRVQGSYDDALIVELPFMPNGYFLTIGTGGAGNLQNLVGLREHKNPVYRGLRVLPGNDQRYPLIESYYTRAFGTGIRQRAGAVVTQIKVGAANSYVIPTNYTRGLGFAA